MHIQHTWNIHTDSRRFELFYIFYSGFTAFYLYHQETLEVLAISRQLILHFANLTYS